MDHTTGTILGQLAISAKSNEIPAVRTLLASFELAAGGGVVVTVDAMHTQTDGATAIAAAGGDYVFTVKSNQPKLYAACRTCPGRTCHHTRACRSGTAAGPNSGSRS